MLIKYNDVYTNFNLQNDSIAVDCKTKTHGPFNYAGKVTHGYEIILNVIIEHQSGNLNVVYKEKALTDFTDDKKALIEKGHKIVNHMIEEWKKDSEQIMDLDSFLEEK